MTHDIYVLYFQEKWLFDEFFERQIFQIMLSVLRQKFHFITNKSISYLHKQPESFISLFPARAPESFRTNVMNYAIFEF